MKENNPELLDNGTIRRKTLVSILCFCLFLAAVVLAWFWIKNSPKTSGAAQPLRTVLDKNEALFGKTLDKQLTPVYPKEEAAKKVRVNGYYGIKSPLDSNEWRLKVVKGPGDTLFLTIDQLKELPKIDFAFNFKCIEGWSQISHWGGVRFSDFIKHFHLEELAKREYVGLVTPDKEYYVGIDMKSMMHPQTILCYEVNEKPLPLNQGFPLRLIIPVKYGVKHLKRIGTMTFSDQRPPDYWYEKGYDYFTGL